MNRMKSGFIQNGYFLLFTFVSGLFYFCFYMVALSFSLSLAFTVIGIPLVIRVLRTTTAFIQFERTQTKLYTDITTEPYKSKVTTGGSVWAQSKSELRDRRNWWAVFWLMQKFWIGLVSLVCTALIYVVPLVCLLAPLLYRHVKMNFIFVEADTFASSLLFMAAGVVLAALSPKLADGLAKKIGGYTRSMIRVLNR